MKKKAEELKQGDKVSVGGRSAEVEEIEVSDIGKQGKKKCRVVLKLDNGEKAVIIRPSDYPFEIL